MTLKGLSKYNVELVDGEVNVTNRYGRTVSSYTSLSQYKPKYKLLTDCGNRKYISIGQLRFMMKHPEVSADAISCRGIGIKFDDDGNVVNLNGGNRKRSYATFTGIEDALNTVLFLMSVKNGDERPLLNFVADSRWNAIVTVARLLKCSISKVSRHFEKAVDEFMKQVKDFNVREIKPLFSWLCKVLKCVVLTEGKVKTCSFLEGISEKKTKDWLS